jgi:chromosome partitioning protein
MRPPLRRQLAIAARRAFTVRTTDGRRKSASAAGVASVNLPKCAALGQNGQTKSPAIHSGYDFPNSSLDPKAIRSAELNLGSGPWVGSMRIVSPVMGTVGVASGSARTAHIIVLANEKGGSGKTTTAMHVIVALLKAGQKVAAVDVDSRQKSLTRYIANRRIWAKKSRVSLELPDLHTIERADGPSVAGNEEAEFTHFAAILNRVETTHDFVVVDTPASDSYLMRLAHSMADSLITPLNDSFVDVDVLASIDPESFEVTGTSHYAEVVREARRQRRVVEEGETDWIVMRNRVGQFETRNGRNVFDGLTELSRRLNFRLSDGFSERVIYREMFPRGLTVLDTLDEVTLGAKPTLSHHAASQEVRNLIEWLRLPIDERGRRRAAARAEWFRSSRHPLEGIEIVAE